MAAKFRQVVALHVFPDHDVMRGREPVPIVDHDSVDFDRLARLMAEHFDCGEQVRLRFPDDTLDHVTLTPPTGFDATTAAAMVRVFGQRLLEATKGSRHPIPIRDRWKDLHYLKDRTYATPPSVILFVVEGTFEAVITWLEQMDMALLIRTADPFNEPVHDDDELGELSDEFVTELEAIFGCHYEPLCWTENLVCSGRPAWVDKLIGELENEETIARSVKRVLQRVEARLSLDEGERCTGRPLEPTRRRVGD